MQTSYCLVQILKRVGYAEAQVALAEFAEGGAGEAGDAGVFEEGVGEFF